MVKDSYDLSDFDRVATKTADKRGRITIGSDFAESEVFVCAIDLTDDIKHSERPPEKEREVLDDLTEWAIKYNFSIEGYDVRNGRILGGDGEWYDTDVEGLDDE